MIADTLHAQSALLFQIKQDLSQTTLGTHSNFESVKLELSVLCLPRIRSRRFSAILELAHLIDSFRRSDGPTRCLILHKLHNITGADEAPIFVSR
jgi:hypothetical protein